MILVDTSAWVEYDRATGSPLDETVTDSIRAGGHSLAVSEPILMEVLAGAGSESRYEALRRLLTSFEWISVDTAADFEGAAKIYRHCRAAGIAPRGFVDCMIASIAIRTGSELLAVDRDFVDIATVVPLRLAG